MMSAAPSRAVGLLRPALFMAVFFGCICVSLLSFAFLPHMLRMRMECRMSRMYPSYVDHSEQLRDYVRSSSPVMKKYSLREYREMNAYMLNPLYDRSLSPIPILFIPGNAGSFAQVRSMASSAFYQYWNRWFEIPSDDMEDVPGPTAWFSIDFNEDFSAFHGKTLEEQAYYVNEAVRYLRAMYSTKGNMSVGIVGHSMGGIVARLALTLPNTEPSSIDTIVTLSTPHAFPPVPFERSMDRVYARINAYKNDTMPLVVSIAGGILDTQLSSDASSLSLFEDGKAPERSLSTFTTAVASLWSSVDHLAIVWCDQLRARIARTFLRDYAYFGSDFAHRTRHSIRDQRREFWRFMLGLSDDAASPRTQRFALETSSNGPAAKAEMTPRILPSDSEKPKPLVFMDTSDIHVDVLYVVIPPGPRQTYEGNMTDADEALAFELITNLSLGKMRDASSNSPRGAEVIVSLCSRAAVFRFLEWCHPALMNGAEPLPFSPVPDQTLNTVFPNAKIQYDAPSATLTRMHFSAAFLQKHEISAVRVEFIKKTDSLPSREGIPTVLSYGWTEDKPLILRGAPGWLRSRTWALLGINVTSLLSSYVEHGPLWEWNLPDMDSSLLAYTFTLFPAPCASRLDPPPPSMAPMVRFLSASTGDARVFPSLHTRARNDLRVALHGTAPFIQEPTHRGTRMQLWLLDDYRNTPYNGTYDMNCPLPYTHVRASVHWRASMALFVLRYRLALLTWPLGILALARALQPTASPLDALLFLMRGRGLLMLILGPLALHVCVFFGASLGAPRHTLGIGITSLSFWWLGPLLSVLATSLALLMYLVTEAAMHVLYVAVRLFMPRFLPSGATHVPSWPTRGAWITWLHQRSTWGTGLALLGLFVMVPYQVLILLCVMLHVGTTCRSYMVYRESGALRFYDHAWLMQFLLWLVPLQAPMFVVWVRNVHAGIVMGLARIESNVLIAAPLLWLIYLEWLPFVWHRPSTFCFEQAHYAVYGTMALCTLIYGIRYGYTILDAFLVTVVYELVYRIVPLYHVRQASETINMRDVSMLALPPSITDPLWEEYLATLEAYMHVRTQAEQALKDGFFQLTRAKMTMSGTFGQRTGRDVYNEHMSAQVRFAQADTGTAPAPSSSGLRRRQGQETIPAPSGATHDWDPVAQFSGLPPPALRAAQRSFQRAITLLVDTNTSQAAIHTAYHLQKKLETLEHDIQRRRS